jgi:hypothetical protein
MIAAPIRDRTADERQRRERQTRQFVGPEKRMMEECTRDDVGQDHDQFTQERHHDNRLGEPVQCAQRNAVVRGERIGLGGHRLLRFDADRLHCVLSVVAKRW